MGHMEYKDYNSLVMDHSGIISYICDMQTHEILYLSKACMKLCSVEKPEDYRKKKCYAILQGLDAPCPFCTNGNLSGGSEYRWEHYNEKLNRWFDVSDSLIRLEDRPCRLEIARDITSRKEKKDELTEQLSMEDVLFRCLNTLTKEQKMDNSFDQFLENIGGFYNADRAYIIEFDMENQLTNNTFEWCATGVSSEIDNLQNIPIAVMDHWIQKFKKIGEFSIGSVDDELDHDAEDYRILQAQGIQSLLAAPLRREGQIVGFVGVDNPVENTHDLALLRAVSDFILEELDKRRLMEELERLSYIDVLTGLGNRNQYAKVLREYETESPKTLGILTADVNGLKEINDLYGYEYGDQVLKRAAEILQEHFSQGLYRIGGDEFQVLCTDLSKEQFQNQVVALRHTFDSDETCNVSMGFAWNFDEDAVDVNLLQQQADDMRYAEKQSYYNTILNQGRTVPRASFAGEVLQEIADDRFVVYYQPQVDIRTGAVIGAEALVRKVAEDGSIIPPMKFLPFYEVGGVISHIDLFVLRTACATLRHWIDQGQDLHISVNFSRVTLLDPYIIDLINGICAEHDVPPSSITIEVTENIGKINRDHLKSLIEKLKAAGFILSLDDFGSEYSNLAILAEMDFDEVKFDRTLVSTLEENEKSRVVMEGGLGLCRALKGTVSLAEGIETKGQLELLAEYNCDYGQGYYFSRPVPLDDFEDFLEKHKQ